ncbi:MAG TPA: hypothetical protein VNG71_12490 [Pyrinomonadaceae bacterium]|nr:hypothetical protein [Pyrinomonadaceae bacterium]
MPEDAPLADDRWPTERIIEEIKTTYLDDDDLSEFWLAEEAGVIAAISSTGPNLLQIDIVTKVFLVWAVQA